MEFLSMFALIVLCVLVVQVLRLLVADSDLTLQWATRFGKATGVLKGKVVWIIGSSSGIGECLAYELAASGCRLVLSARREEELERVKRQCLVSGRLGEDDILVLPLDIIKFESHARAVETVVNRFKRVDILVNNAARGQMAFWTSTSLEVDRQSFEVNVLGVLSLTKLVLPHMISQGGGHVVVTSSFAGKMASPGNGSYAGSKFALQGYFETLRVEENHKNIAVTILCPGPVYTDLISHAFTDSPGERLQLTPSDMSSIMDKKTFFMSSARCGELSAIAIANQLDEVWMAKHPFLLLLYLWLYTPYLGRRLLIMVYNKYQKPFLERITNAKDRQM